ncbi:MAG: hypothetical protein ACJ74W_24065 [Pyrinomonadaceae bacterium]
MAEDRTLGSVATGVSQNKGKGVDITEAPPAFGLPVMVKRKDSPKIWWTDCSHLVQAASSLAAIVNEVREIFQLSTATILKVYTSASENLLDESISLSTLLSSLQISDYLIVYVEEVEELAGTNATNTPKRGTGKRKGAGRTGKRSEISGIITKADTKTAETIEIRGNIRKRHRVIFFDDHYVLIQRKLLELLKEKVEHPLMLESVCLFLGVLLGAIVTILVALSDDKMADLGRERLHGALIASIFASIFMFVIGYFVRMERKKFIQPIIDELADKGGEEKDNEQKKVRSMRIKVLPSTK